VKKTLLTGVAALFLATGTAHTETDVLGCFVRTYDKAHLAEHPDQLVTAVKLHIYHPSLGEGTPPLAENTTWMKMQVKTQVDTRGETPLDRQTASARRANKEQPLLQLNGHF
jgi:hypothetical protein